MRSKLPFKQKPILLTIRNRNKFFEEKNFLKWNQLPLDKCSHLTRGLDKLFLFFWNLQNAVSRSWSVKIKKNIEPDISVIKSSRWRQEDEWHFSCGFHELPKYNSQAEKRPEARNTDRLWPSRNTDLQVVESVDWSITKLRFFSSLSRWGRRFE